ncbi:MAG: ComEA family DNA-binding protein [Limnochordia bacterium]|jgi:DNA uptake protein ComE-like DNA-binding protein
MSQQQQVRLLVVLIAGLLVGVGCRWWITMGPARGNLVWIGAPLMSRAQAAKLPENRADGLTVPLEAEADEAPSFEVTDVEEVDEEEGAQEAASSSGLLDLNVATQRDLEALPGIGPVLARNILDERARRGGFLSVADLLSVKGIGPARYARIAPWVCVTTPEP